MLTEIHTIKLLLLPILVLFSVSMSAADKPLTIKEQAPSSYTVKKGDTLWDILELYLEDPCLWPRLWKANSYINNPHLIYPGDKLTLSWLDGQPVLSLKPYKSLTPKLRKTEKEVVPTLPDSRVLPYIKSDRLVNKQILEDAERVVGTSDGRKFLTANDQLYISGEHGHQKWGIYRQVSEFEREDNGDKAYALRLVATAKLKSVESNFSGLEIVAQQQEILPNDLALPEHDIEKLLLSTTYYPAPAPEGMQASILGSIDGGKYAALNQVVVLDRGAKDQIEQGNMFKLFESGSDVFGKKGTFSYDAKDDDQVKLPDTGVGSLMIIRPYESFSLAIITDSSTPISRHIYAASPVTE